MHDSDVLLFRPPLNRVEKGKLDRPRDKNRGHRFCWRLPRRWSKIQRATFYKNGDRGEKKMDRRKFPRKDKKQVYPRGSPGHKYEERKTQGKGERNKDSTPTAAATLTERERQVANRTKRRKEPAERQGQRKEQRKKQERQRQGQRERSRLWRKQKNLWETTEGQRKRQERQEREKFWKLLTGSSHFILERLWNYHDLLQKIYMYDREKNAAYRPQPNQIPWPVLLLLGCHSMKHQFLQGKKPKIEEYSKHVWSLYHKLSYALESRTHQKKNGGGGV